MTFDAIVLAGGAARRLGGVDKPMLDVDGTPMLTRVLAAVAAAQRRVVVGPRRPLEPDVVWCRERPPGGGPVAGLAAGLPHTTAPVVMVLAADLPWIAPAVAALLGALSEPGAPSEPDALSQPDALDALSQPGELSGPGADHPGVGHAPDVALLRTGERRNYLAAAWRRSTLASALAGIDVQNLAMRTLVAAAHDAGATVADVQDQGWGDDCDTWADLARARARSIDRSWHQK